MTEDNFHQCLVSFTNEKGDNIQYLCRTVLEYDFVISGLSEFAKKSLLVRRLYTVEDVNADSD